MGKFRDGVNFTALREVKLLQELRHENIIELVDVFSRQESIHLVFDYMETDLETVITDRGTMLTAAHTKSYMYMLLQGLDFCHQNWVLHRDLKPNNLLFGSDGVMKLADFGLARFYGSPNLRMTCQVVTLWYRSPELLFGAREYGGAVDMWAVGCIFAELLLRRPLFPGLNDLDQLGKIFHVTGTPTEENWPGVSLLPNYLEFSPAPAMDYRQLLSAATPDVLDLLARMLILDPSKRITTAQALQHEYFNNPPEPTAPINLPRPSPTDRADAAVVPVDTKSEASSTTNPKSVEGKKLDFS